MSEWKEVRLGELLNLITKGTTPPKGKGFVDIGVNYIKSDAINYNGKIDISKFVAINEETHVKFKRSQLEELDILFSMAGAYLGKTGIVLNEMLPANTNQALAILRINKEKAIPHFIWYFLRQPAIIDYVNSMSGQSAQPNINFQEISSIEIKLPTIQEQKAIAEVLSSLDDKIDLLNRQNETLEAMAETLFRQWFVEEADDEWEESVLGDITDIKAGGDKPKVFSETKTESCNIPIYSNGINNEGLYGFTDRAKITAESITISARGTIGYVCLRQEPYVPIVRLISIVPNEKFVSSKYLYLWAKSQNISGTGTTQQQLTVPEFCSTKVIIPPINIMNEFTLSVNALFDKMQYNKHQIKTLAKTRDTLLPKLMSGEVRII